MSILKVENINKSFNSKSIISDLSFDVKENSIYGFLGINGAGKTTVMKMILGLYKIDSGNIFVNEELVKFGETNTNKYIGYLPDVPSFYEYMTAYEYLKLCGNILNLDNLDNRINEMLSLVSLKNDNNKIKGFSRGQKQRLGLAQALLNKPKLLICDEPTSALDPIGRSQILNILKEASKYTTIIFSTHILSDVEQICDHIGILNEGSLIIDEPIVELKTKYVNKLVKISLSNEKEVLVVSNIFRDAEVEGLEVTINEELKDVYNTLVENNIYPLKLEKQSLSLEDIFMEVIND